MEEIEAIYRVHHATRNKSRDQQARLEKAHQIDSIHEFEVADVDALPSFAELGAEGHHSDV